MAALPDHVDPTKDHSRVSPEGRKIGEMIADRFDRAQAILADQGEPDDERCKSCAGRRGTVPNGCLVTMADLTKALIERVPFLCHQHDKRGEPCHAWYAIAATTKSPPPGTTVPWDFSPPDAD